MDEYFCPNCGAILNDQYGFAPDGGTWRCTECGELLVDDDVYNGDSFEGIAWYCDSCADSRIVMDPGHVLNVGIITEFQRMIS